MVGQLLFLVVPEAFGRMGDRRYVKRIHDENLKRLRSGESVYLPDAGEAEDSLSERVREFHEYTKEEIRNRGERERTTESGAELYRLPEDARRDVEELTERASAKVKRQNRRAYIATFAVGVLVFGPLVSFLSLVL